MNLGLGLQQGRFTTSQHHFFYYGRDMKLLPVVSSVHPQICFSVYTLNSGHSNIMYIVRPVFTSNQGHMAV